MKHRGKKWKLRSKWYRSPSLSSRPDPYFAADFDHNRALSYKASMLGRELPIANMLHETQTLEEWQQWIADQPGAATVEERISAQCRQLEMISMAACERLGEALIWRGFGALVAPWGRYRGYQAEKTCGQCDGSGEQPFDGGPCVLCDGVGSYNAIDYRQEPGFVRRNGYFTDGKRVVYVGSKRARGYYAQQLKPLQILLASGRDPGPEEVEAILDDALAEQQSLL